jgi:hypothetical protein
MRKVFKTGENESLAFEMKLTDRLHDSSIIRLAAVANTKASLHHFCGFSRREADSHVLLLNRLRRLGIA